MRRARAQERTMGHATRDGLQGLGSELFEQGPGLW